MSDDDAALNGDERRATPAAQARKKKAVVWQDPFAQ